MTIYKRQEYKLSRSMNIYDTIFKWCFLLHLVFKRNLWVCWIRAFPIRSILDWITKPDCAARYSVLSRQCVSYQKSLFFLIISLKFSSLSLKISIRGRPILTDYRTFGFKYFFRILSYYRPILNLFLVIDFRHYLIPGVALYKNGINKNFKTKS